MILDFLFRPRHAVRLAAAGMTAAPDALEHPSGFLAALSPKGRIDPKAGLGRWHILRHGLNIKRYPVCYPLHRSIDAVLATEIDASQVQSVEVRVGKLQAAMLRHSSPQNALDAKFSAQFTMAAALLERRVGLAELTDEFVRREAVQALMRKVRVTTTNASDPDEPLFAPTDVVRARYPIGLRELRAKFDDCTGGRQAGLFDRLLQLEQVGVRALIS